MLTRQLEHLSWVRRQVPQDLEMGPPTGGWAVAVDFQNSYEAGWLECPVRYFEGEAPDTEPVLREEVRRILDSGVTRGGRFVLREGNNLPPRVSLENLWAVYDGVREFGAYDRVEA